ncbi:histidinol-phosphate transaminase [Parachryseolinea silvisoli]|jgi:histidinol-phosphate aminotransferase|uniref:histidinol-phosphate transaminase n=1 Tax=Parachryseolinea silvisoli TaxID=2873601 RepID=UPI002265C3D1|nr:histidinol-phosphate transaminase [Parachryseolinea silvisoli]MCD9014026.1 histidinol-phosphate transaminase [Parachryseolinea silvisoli]
MSKKKTFPDINTLVRKNILTMKPYSSARDEFKGEADIYLDANENPYQSPYNRYPDPLQRRVKDELATVKEVRPEQIFLGNGSDEAIDLIIRAFCEPNQDSILITEPTYGMYSVCAEVNAVNVQQVLLTPDFDLDLEAFPKTFDATTKVIFLCSPNNPTGNLLSRDKILEVLKRFYGLVVIDEAYIDFAKGKSFLQELDKYPNLVVLQTFSKAWGLAGLRLGMAFASEAIINVLNKIKYPYNVNIRTQELALDALENRHVMEDWVKQIVQQRTKVIKALEKLRITEKVFPTDSNFVLVRVQDAPATYKYLLDQKIIVRDRSRVVLCYNCLRITIGTPEENERLLNALEEL